MLEWLLNINVEKAFIVGVFGFIFLLFTIFYLLTDPGTLVEAHEACTRHYIHPDVPFGSEASYDFGWEKCAKIADMWNSRQNRAYLQDEDRKRALVESLAK